MRLTQRQFFRQCSFVLTAMLGFGTIGSAALRAEHWTNLVMQSDSMGQAEFLPIALATSVPMSHADRHFIEKALQVVRDEMRLSHLAMERGTNEHVKDFALRIFTAQSNAEKTLTVLAASKGVTTRNEMRSDRYFSALNQKEGEDFDLYFVAHLVDVEDDTLTLFEKSAHSDDPDIAAFASRISTSLQAHMLEAKAIERELRHER